MRGGFGGRAAVAAASALLAVSLAGGPLYVSSSTSEALQVSLASTCPTTAGLSMDIPGDVADEIIPQLEEELPANSHLGAPVRTLGASVRVDTDDGSSLAFLLWRDGYESQLGARVDAPEGMEVLAPLSAARISDISSGDTLELSDGNGEALGDFDVIGDYPDIPVQPEPAYWCGLADLLRPDPSGNQPPPMLLTSEAAMQAVEPVQIGVTWEVWPRGADLTRDDAAEVVDDLEALRARYRILLEAADSQFTPQQIPMPSVPRLVQLIANAEEVGTVVGRTMAPIRLGGLIAALGLVAVAGVLVARERRDELRLRLIRGEGPGGIAMRVAESQIVSVLVGTVAGFAAAFLAVRMWGPTPEIESGPLRTALIWSGVGLIAALATLGIAGAVAANSTVDHAPRRRRLIVPWEVLLVVLAVISYQRLNRYGGVHLVGAEARGGDLLAQAFPLLAVAAPVAVLVRPARWLLRRARRSSPNLPTPMLLGWRRIGSDPGPSALVAAAVGLGVGTFLVASSLTASAEQMLRDKANTFLGADLRVVVSGEAHVPDDLTGTVVSRTNARSDGLTVQVLGVDPATFADAVRWRDDASPYSLQQLLDVLMVDDMEGAPLPAIVVGGPLPSTDLTSYNNLPFEVQSVAEADFFPGKTSVPLIVVNREALGADSIPSASEVWLKDPPPDAAEQLAADGLLVRGQQAAVDVFDVVSFLAVRWSYSAMRAFAVLVGLVTILAQLLVLDARRRTRQASWILSRPMGERPGEELGAAITELGVPFLLGAAVGGLVGWVVVRLSVGELDTLGNLPPPARAVVETGSLGVAVLVGVAAVLVLAAVSLLGVLAAKPMEVMRGGVES